MTAMRQIETLEDIRQLVDRFYGKVCQDEVLADICNKVIGYHWPDHLNKMYRFWQQCYWVNTTIMVFP